MLRHSRGDLDDLDDLDDQLVIDAVCMRLSAGVEALSGLDVSTRDRLFGEAWPLMWGMRNRIAHGYLLVNAGIVRRTLEHDIQDWADEADRGYDQVSRSEVIRAASTSTPSTRACHVDGFGSVWVTLEGC
jgi:uncharacterized protein with HEPN domain